MIKSKWILLNWIQKYYSQGILSTTTAVKRLFRAKEVFLCNLYNAIFLPGLMFWSFFKEWDLANFLKTEELLEEGDWDSPAPEGLSQEGGYGSCHPPCWSNSLWEVTLMLLALRLSATGDTLNLSSKSSAVTFILPHPIHQTLIVDSH